MNWWTVAAAAVGGALAMAVLGIYLVYRSHENLRKMFHAHPKGK